MKRGYIAMVLLLFVTCGLRAEIIDRIAAVANEKIITASDVRQERRIMAIFDEGQKTDEEILQDLIDRALVEDQLSQFAEIDITAEELIEAARGLTVPGDVSREEVLNALRLRMLRARFFELRFRQFITATDDDIQKYYEDVFVPEARTRGLSPIPPLEQAADSIRANIVDERMTAEVELWIETVRRRSNVEIFR
jgi:hypothetical protein